MWRISCSPSGLGRQEVRRNLSGPVVVVQGVRAFAGVWNVYRGGDGVDPLLFIVSRDQRDLHAYLIKEFRRDEHIQIIVDRRVGDRRCRVEPPAKDQRRGARRRTLAMDRQIRSVGFALVRGIPES